MLTPCKFITGYTTVLPRGPYRTARGALIASSAVPTHRQLCCPHTQQVWEPKLRNKGTIPPVERPSSSAAGVWGRDQKCSAPLQNQLLCVQRAQYREKWCSGSIEENPPGKCLAWDQHPSHTARLHTQTGAHVCSQQSWGELGYPTPGCLSRCFLL